jgi:hypothetical protein
MSTEQLHKEKQIGQPTPHLPQMQVRESFECSSTQVAHLRTCCETSMGLLGLRATLQLTTEGKTKHKKH